MARQAEQEGNSRAEELTGPPVAELGEEVAELMRAAWRSVAAVLDGEPHNKVLAVQLLLSQRARGLQPDDHEKWRLSVATTLVGGMISAPPRHDDKGPPAEICVR